MTPRLGYPATPLVRLVACWLTLTLTGVAGVTAVAQEPDPARAARLMDELMWAAVTWEGPSLSSITLGKFERTRTSVAS